MNRKLIRELLTLYIWGPQVITMTDVLESGHWINNIKEKLFDILSNESRC